MKKHAKRLNGVSIDQRPDEINKRESFGHWELDLIEGKRNTKFNLLTMCERKTKFGFAVKIFGKSKEMKLILKSAKDDNCQCNFKLIKKEPQAPTWFKSFVNNEFKPTISKLNSRIDNLENRFDHLVKVNKLKE